MNKAYALVVVKLNRTNYNSMSVKPIQSCIKPTQISLPSANEVAGREFSYICLSFCSRGGGGGCLPTMSWARQTLPLYRQTPSIGRPTHRQPPCKRPTTGIIILQDTVNKRAVRIILECILVTDSFGKY